ncbi:DUF3299 domain-containing protein [Aliamphritea hakodatensis]|uniref:DUF3299 domain-containing protein n=1 Tax=Aliamphritea hakodatensis TaxID=2895352 RepID=UPI0022FD5C7B|nr:DUF3299 domain-containing protein [Aliamphritea hakodatensis]
MFKFCVSVLLSLLVLLPLPASAANTFNGEPVEELDWEMLMPADYNIEAIFAATADQYSTLDDFDPLAEIKFKALMESLASAPVVPEMDGKMIRIPGFVVPLSEEGTRVTEFFLVPFFGACIHVPPPPSNQMIHVAFEPGTNVENLYDAVWVTGKLKIATVAHDLGTAGYVMDAFQIEPYEEG